MSLEKPSNFLRFFSAAEMNGNGKPSYRFKSFLLNSGERQLLRNGEPISLTPKVFDTLVYLVENAGHLVEKGELMESVWRDSIVEEGNLTRSIHALRRALGQDGNGNTFIETVPTKGYRFVAEVTKDICRPAALSAGVLVTEKELPRPPIEKMPGDAVHDPNSSGDKAEVRPASRYALVAGGFLLAATLIAVLSFSLKPGQEGVRPITIAVMPLKALDPNDEDAAFKLAVADSLVGQLSAANDFRVMPLSATWQYLDVAKDPAAAGRELNVQYVLASSYQIVDGRVRLTSQLVNVSSGTVEGSFKSERAVAGAFETQDLIAADVGDAIAKQFGMLAGDVVRRRGTANDEAYGYVLQAEYMVNSRRGSGALPSLQLVEKAIALDPNFARAYAVRAYAYRSANWQPSRHGLTHEECDLKSKEAVETALRLDPNSSDAHTMLGEIEHTYGWNSAAAEAAFRRAIQLNPRSAHARRFYALFLIDEEKFDEAVEQANAAIEIEPATVFGHQILGMVYHRARRYDEAIAQLRRVREMDPGFASGIGMIWRSYYLKGEPETAFIEFRKLFEDAGALAKLDKAYADGGWQGVFRMMADRLEKGEDARGVTGDTLSPLNVYIALGDHDKALKLMEERVSKGNRNRAGVKFPGPWLDPLRREPRFQALMTKLGY